MGVGQATEWWRVAEPGPPPSRTIARQHDDESPLPFWALLTFTFVLLIAPQTFIPALGPLRLAMVAAVAGIVGHVHGRIARRRPVTVWTPEIAATGCLVCWAAVTVPISLWPGGSVSFLLGIYLKTVAVFWLLCNVVTTVPKLRTMAWGLVLMSVPLAMTAVKNYLSGTFAYAAQPVVNRIVGYDAPLALNPNDLALVLNLIAPLAIALLLSGQTFSVRVALAAIVALDAIAVILTYSRTGFITLVAIGAVTLWKMRHRREAPWLWGALVLALACVPLLPAGYSDRLSTISDVDSDPTGSSQARWADMIAAARFVARNPIVGAGIGLDILALNEERGAKWVEVHDTYLEYAVELGLPGLALFLVLLIASIRSARFAQRTAGDEAAGRALFHLAEGIETSLLGFVVAAVFSPGGYQFAFYYFAGLAVAARVCASDGELTHAPA
jgi:putative inorganic carbon (HCO3(-)) transporter